MTDEVILAQDLTRRFGDFTAVDHITFSVRQGEVVGYLGPNGSGKTTTIRMLLGLLLPSEGSARVLGYDIVSQAEQIRAQVGYMCQKFGLYHDLTVGENLVFYAGVYGVRDRQHLEGILEQVGLADRARERVSALSAGWRQRLALATAIVHRPRLLFLDEPTSGVDPTARRSFWDLIYSLVAQGITAVVTTHYMDEAEYCSQVGIMRDGRLLAMDTPSALKEKALVGRSPGVPGQAWDVFIEDGQAASLLPALSALQGCASVQRAGLAGDHLRAITSSGTSTEILLGCLRQAGIQDARLEVVQPSLEDVFLALASP